MLSDPTVLVLTYQAAGSLARKGSYYTPNEILLHLKGFTDLLKPSYKPQVTQDRGTWVQAPAFQSLGYVALDPLGPLSEAQFPPLCNGDTLPCRGAGGLYEITPAICPAPRALDSLSPGKGAPIKHSLGWRVTGPEAGTWQMQLANTPLGGGCS